MNKNINYLLGYENLKIIQNDEMFKCSLDSILLPNFVTINKNCKKIMDIGSGNCPMSLILTTKTSAKIIAVELQKEVYEMGLETIKINNLESQIDIINEDINTYYLTIETDTIDTIICNPPYFKINEKSNLNNSEYKTIARHEKTLNLEQIMIISKKILKNNGNLALVHRPERLIDIILLMKKNNIEPKKIQFVCPSKNKEANILLIEGTKNGKSGLTILPQIISHNNDGTYTDEIKKFFS